MPWGIPDRRAVERLDRHPGQREHCDGPEDGAGGGVQVGLRLEVGSEVGRADPVEQPAKQAGREPKVFAWRCVRILCLARLTPSAVLFQFIPFVGMAKSPKVVHLPGLARKAPSFRAGMDSAEAEGLRWVQSGVACCSMYCRIILIGAPPQDAAKYDGDQRTPFQYRRSRSFRSFLSNRLDTPFRLLTRADTATLGGYSTNK